MRQYVIRFSRVDQDIIDKLENTENKTDYIRQLIKKDLKNSWHFLYECLKEGVKPSEYQAKKLCDINPAYWDAVIDGCKDLGCINAYNGLQITLDGVEYLDSNKPMKKVRKAIGDTFEEVLKDAIDISRLC